MKDLEEDTPKAFEAIGVAILASGWIRVTADILRRGRVAWARDSVFGSSVEVSVLASVRNAVSRGGAWGWRRKESVTPLVSVLWGVPLKSHSLVWLWQQGSDIELPPHRRPSPLCAGVASQLATSCCHGRVDTP